MESNRNHGQKSELRRASCKSTGANSSSFTLSFGLEPNSKEFGSNTRETLRFRLAWVSVDATPRLSFSPTSSSISSSPSSPIGPPYFHLVLRGRRCLPPVHPPARSRFKLFFTLPLQVADDAVNVGLVGTGRWVRTERTVEDDVQDSRRSGRR
ncbi:hypothetical protein GYMLUDRAFT_396940 [Collybiopsis luxurians FD-317 M1]|uniref:Uncharacterized protein n=1 Tax=Collybiopsis luxurians FD-317 M1 TaxID=944289 RepID=A0A0D0BP45_9AGAR|nr:hypothetical protein GYMLUDRAFT_396940 [Collybiopsis luxurians FD-317 M1]